MAKRRNLASDLPKLDARNLSTTLLSESTSSCYSPTSLVREFKSELVLSPCYAPHYIPHNALLPPRETNSKGRIPGQWLRMLLAVSGGEARPTLLPAHWTRSLSYTKTADEDVKKQRGGCLFIALPGLDVMTDFYSHPYWGVNSPLWVELMTPSLRKDRNDIKERITPAAQNSPKSPEPLSFQEAARIQATATSGFATKSGPRKIMKWGWMDARRVAGYVSLHNVLDHSLCHVI